MSLNQTVDADFPALMTASEVANKLRVTPEFITKLARSGEIPGAFQVGRKCWRIPRAYIDGLLGAVK